MRSSCFLHHHSSNQPESNDSHDFNSRLKWLVLSLSISQLIDEPRRTCESRSHIKGFVNSVLVQLLLVRTVTFISISPSRKALSSQCCLELDVCGSISPPAPHSHCKIFENWSSQVFNIHLVSEKIQLNSQPSRLLVRLTD